MASSYIDNQTPQSAVLGPDCLEAVFMYSLCLTALTHSMYASILNYFNSTNIYEVLNLSQTLS